MASRAAPSSSTTPVSERKILPLRAPSSRRRRMKGNEDEFPLLSAMGLYAADTKGDGNCLFNALSDQLYGDQKHHAEIRLTVIDYMTQNADYYKQFIDACNGGATRRQPKRKNVNGYSESFTSSQPTPEDIDRVFQAHLRRMAQGGTYGDNMEIQAFAAAFNKNVKIFQRDFAFIMHGGPDEIPRATVYIAYHAWEHYSSIRNLDGPHAGPPQVKERVLSPEEEKEQKGMLDSAPVALPWQIDLVSKSLPFLVDKPLIKKKLEEYKNNLDAVVSHFLDAEEGSVSSAQESSSVEREADSDDDQIYGPNKRQNRRMSKSTAVVMKNKQDDRHELVKLEQNDSSQVSVAGSNSSDSDWRESSQPVTDDERSSMPPSSQEEKIKVKLNMSAAAPSKMQSGRTHARQQGPRPRARVSAREKKDQRKQAQKNARKQRAQAEAAQKSAKELPIRTSNKITTSFTESFRTIAI